MLCDDLIFFSRVAATARAAGGVGLKQIAEGFVSPVILLPAPDGSGKLLVGDQVGVVHVLSADGKSEKTFLDLRDRLTKLNQGFDERGILGMAFHPKFKENRKFYVYYSAPLRSGAPQGWDHTSHISEFKVSEKDSLQADPASEKVLQRALTEARAGRHSVDAFELNGPEMEALYREGLEPEIDFIFLASYGAGTISGGRVKVLRDVETDLAFIDKRRPKGTHNVAQAVEVIGDVRGRSCVLVDDIIDTGGTITSAADLLVDRGAKDVTIAATHGLLSGAAAERLASANVREVVVTNTIPVPDEKRWDALTVLSVAPVIAEAIKAVFEDTSVSEIFRGDNV